MDAVVLDLASAWPHDPTAERVLTAVFEEIRWAHPGVRICCGAFASDASVRVVASSQPSTMQALAGSCVVGNSVHRYREMLEGVEDLSSDDVASDGRFADIPPTILGSDTGATVTLPLRARGRVLGFLRVDAPAAARITAKLVAALHQSVAPALIAVSLEPDLMLSHQRARQLLQARKWVLQRLEREHESISALRDGLDDLSHHLERHGRELSPDARRSLELALETVEQRLELAAAGLDRHARESADAPFFPESAVERLTRNQRRDLAETPSETVPSTGGRPG
jgi:hypothetical protein